MYSERVVVAHVDVFLRIGIVVENANAVAGCLPLAGELGGRGLLIGVARNLHLSFLVDHDNGNGGIVLDDLQHKVHAVVAVVDVQRAHGLRPDLHLLVLLFIEVASQEIGRHQRGNSDEHRCHHEQNLRLSYSVSPLHTSVRLRRCSKLLRSVQGSNALRAFKVLPPRCCESGKVLSL